MPEDAESPPVKRGPGRPRKVAAPKVEPAPPADEWKTVETGVQLDDLDRGRIGQEVNVTATDIGYDDGRQYRCADGKIVERIA